MHHEIFARAVSQLVEYTEDRSGTPHEYRPYILEGETQWHECYWCGKKYFPKDQIVEGGPCPTFTFIIERVEIVRNMDGVDIYKTSYYGKPDRWIVKLYDSMNKLCPYAAYIDAERNSVEVDGI